MTFSKCLLLAALSLSATAYAQTSQTFHFGEGQSTPEPGHTTHAKPRAKPAKHSSQHRHTTTTHSPQQNAYSHP
ncbi:hypothetical protein [Paraburkholderia acidisoli]|uniref:Uncharacterized protein n=1 Tax=Paraburkholderia acidisoli TaxID=2571748 RepID=A0A7Z2JIT2_9BURK|nr:hypothetical protein [Paraburkholderia acidisoli]QGZ64689.1 hypothetical protein FAZ98_22915 [Paraburkholderia acidisoli]